MAVTHHKSSRTIRGIKYDYGDTFKCYASYGGTGNSEGGGGTAADLTAGQTYYYLGYAIDDDTGNLASYPYAVGTTSSGVHGWFKENIFPYAKYTIAYNANGGTGAPSSQTKTHGTNLTISSTKPTRTGYTFKGWALTKADADDGNWYYSSGSTCGKNENLTLYAVWEENILTINFYSNYADYGTYQGESLSVGASKNVIVYTKDYLYDNAYSSGLSDVQNSEYLYLSRTGYTPTGNWGTSTSGGTLIDEKASFETGQELAEAVGKTLKTGNATVNLYVQWSENVLTIHYYSNYATSAFDGALNTVGATKNVEVYKSEIYYDNDYSTYGLANYSSSGGAAYMTRTGYSPTGYWGTTTSGGTLINEDDKSYTTGQSLAKALGKDISKGDASINVYAQWDANSYTYNIVYKSSSGTQLGTATISKDYGTTNTVSPKSFTGYTSPSSQSIKWDSTSAKTIAFTYTPISYDITINCNGGSGVSSRTYTIETATFTLGTPTRTGYTFSGWTGSNGTTAQKTVSISKGSTGDKSYTAQWDEHKLTVNYYSNKADYGTFEGNALNVSASTNVLVHSQEFLYDNQYSNGLSDVQNTSYLYLSRIGYKPTGYWETSVNGGKLVNQSTPFATGQDLAVALGKTIANGDVLVDVYPQWKPAGIVYIDNGTKLEAYLPYIDNGTSWDLYLAYVDNGTNWDIIS